MIFDLMPYPSMKELGVPWLGNVPEHWSTRRLRTLARSPIKNGVGESAQAFREDWPRYVRITDIAGARSLREQTRASLPPDVAAEASLAPGDLLLAAVGATYGKSYLHGKNVGSACYAGYLVRIRPNNEDVLPEFLSYWSESAYYWNQVKSQVIQATIQNFSAARVKGLRVPLPPLAEQAAIVRFLDYVDRRIRRYIGAKQKLIKLLEEQKRAIIHRAVTRGLDPDVRLKRSGVEWLGDVPEHWSTQPLKRICRFEYGESLPTEVRQEGPVPVFGSNGRVGSHLRSNTRAPCIVIGRKGSFGKVNYSVDAIFAIDTTYFIDERSTATDIRWLSYVLGWLQLDQVSKDSAVPGLAREDAYQRLVVVPSRVEQAAAVRFLDAEVASLDAAEARAYREIALLREYRTRLIADVVTGKVDVREAAARLPDEADEPEPLDDADPLTEAGDAALDDLDAVLEEARA